MMFGCSDITHCASGKGLVLVFLGKPSARSVAGGLTSQKDMMHGSKKRQRLLLSHKLLARSAAERGLTYCHSDICINCFYRTKIIG
jgi:hypothetical protein